MRWTETIVYFRKNKETLKRLQTLARMRNSSIRASPCPGHCLFPKENGITSGYCNFLFFILFTRSLPSSISHFPWISPDRRVPVRGRVSGRGGRFLRWLGQLPPFLSGLLYFPNIPLFPHDSQQCQRLLLWHEEGWWPPDWGPSGFPWRRRWYRAGRACRSSLSGGLIRWPCPFPRASSPREYPLGYGIFPSKIPELLDGVGGKRCPSRGSTSSCPAPPTTGRIPYSSAGSHFIWVTVSVNSFNLKLS